MPVKFSIEQLVVQRRHLAASARTSASPSSASSYRSMRRSRLRYGMHGLLIWVPADLLPVGDMGHWGPILAGSLTWPTPSPLQGRLRSCTHGETAPGDPPGTRRLLLASAGGGDGFEDQTVLPWPHVTLYGRGRAALPACWGTGLGFPERVRMRLVSQTSGVQPAGRLQPPKKCRHPSSSTKRSSLGV